MINISKILLLGGTGAIGVYLIPELINLGFDVFVTSRSVRVSDTPKLTYILGNARDNMFMEKVLYSKYDAIIDFMVYSTEEFRNRYELLLNNTKHYIFLSTYRVYAESKLPIKEDSSRLLDVSSDKAYLETDEYALAKARQENIIRESQYKNWTIVRPTITYSKTRFQLGTLEADIILFRSLCNCSVILPQEMLYKQTTMTWAGDVSRMIALIVLNQNAFNQDFNVCTDEHHTWDEIAQYYKKLIGLNLVPTSLDTYIKIIGGRYQILYDRMYNRVMDNSKILEITGIKKASLTSLYDGLEKELSNHSNIQTISQSIKVNYSLNARIDKVTHSHITKENATLKGKLSYYLSYYNGSYFLLNVIRKLLI